jgi:methionyl-tRNA formyltransferase
MRSAYNPTHGVWTPPKTTTCGIAGTRRAVALIQFVTFPPLTCHNGGATLASSNKGDRTMIIETSANQLFKVWEAAEPYPQAWIGIEVKRLKVAVGMAPHYQVKAHAREQQVRKAATRVVDAAAV